MKKLKYLFLTAFLVISYEWASASKMRVTDSEAAEIYRDKGVGAEYYFKDAFGNIRRMRVVGIEKGSDPGSLTVELERVDNILRIDFSDETVSSKPQAIPEGQEEKGASVSGQEAEGSGYGDLSKGVGTGLLAAAQYVLITDSKLLAQIENSQRVIAEMRKQIGNDLQAIEQVRVGFNKSVTKLNVVLKKGLLEPRLEIGSLGVAEGPNLKISMTSSDLSHYQWQSVDPEFVNLAEKIREKLIQAKIKDELDRHFFNISEESLKGADVSSWSKQKEEADFLLEVARLSADVLLGLHPVSGTALGIYETVMGSSLITGAPLSPGERVLSAVGIFTAGYLLMPYKIFKVLRPIAKRLGFPNFKTYEHIRDFLNKTGNGFRLVGTGSTIRKINFKPPTLADWGLSQYHLNRHFFGSGKLSLARVDPGGNADAWMQNMVRLTQMPVTRVHKDGIFDVFGYFRRADGSAYYRMGVRLKKSPDNSFDLITVLTEQ